MRKLTAAVALLAALFTVSTAQGADIIQPYILASNNTSNLENSIAETLEKLQDGGFEIAGQYSPFTDTNIIVVTNDTLKAIAAKSKRSGYAAGQRVAVNRVGDNIEVSYINPVYIQYAYRLDGDMQTVQDQLKASLGYIKAYGVEKTKTTAKKLKKYHYMFGMQYFDDPSELAKFKSHQDAVTATEDALNKEGDALSMVYRIDIPGSEQTVFGVSMKAINEDENDLDDAFQMGIVDFQGPKKNAYLPYEILVTGNKVEALHMRFRMAVHFPDLSMMGDNSFMKLMASPKAIEKALEGLFED